MTKIKRLLAGSLAVMMAASVMTACGKDESSGLDSEANQKAAEVGPLKLTKADSETTTLSMTRTLPDSR